MGQPRRIWTAREIALAHEYAADPSKTRPDLIRAVKCGSNSLPNLLKAAGVEKWTAARHPGHTPEDEVLAKVLPLAADPAVSINEAYRRTGYCPQSIRRICKKNGIEWVYRDKSAPLPREVIEDLKRYAADPGVSIRDASRAMGVPEGTISTRVRAHGIKWAGSQKRGRKQAKPVDIDQLRSMARDNRTTLKEASKQFGVHESTLRKHLHRHGITWIQGRPPPPPPLESEKKREVSKPVVVKRKPVPKVSVPEFILEPCTKMGTQGFAWRCEFLQARGWKAGTDREQVEAELRRDLAYPTSRHSTVIAREGMAA